jgi:hypothetical protein
MVEILPAPLHHSTPFIRKNSTASVRPSAKRDAAIKGKSWREKLLKERSSVDEGKIVGGLARTKRTEKRRTWTPESLKAKGGGIDFISIGSTILEEDERFCASPAISYEKSESFSGKTRSFVKSLSITNSLRRSFSSSSLRNASIASLRKDERKAEIREEKRSETNCRLCYYDDCVGRGEVGCANCTQCFLGMGVCGLNGRENCIGELLEGKGGAKESIE